VKEVPIPIVCWYCRNFPRELSGSIAEIGQSVRVPDTGKLKRAFDAVSTFYDRKLRSNAQELERQTTENGEIVEKIGKFLAQLFASANTESVSSILFLNDSTRQAVVLAAISRLRQTAIDFSAANSQLNSELTEIFSRLRTKSISESISAITSIGTELRLLKEAEEEHENAIKKTHTKIRRLKKGINAIGRDCDSQLEQQNKVIANYENLKTQLELKLSHAKKRHKELRDQITQLSEEHQETIERIMKSHNREIQGKEDNERKCSEQLTAKDKEIETLVEQSKEQQQEIAKWKHTADLLSRARTEKEVEFQRHVLQNDEKGRKLQRKYEQEIRQIRSQYQQSLSSVTSRPSQLRSLVDNLTTSLNESSAQNEALTGSNEQLALENQELHARLAVLQEEQKRAQQLALAKLRALELSEGSHRQISIEETRAESREDKRKIYGFVVECFAQWFDGRKELNDETFYQFVRQVSLELKKYQKQDSEIRRLLGVSATESCEHALEQLMTSLYKGNK
jgi:hypothetical protein